MTDDTRYMGEAEILRVIAHELRTANLIAYAHTFPAHTYAPLRVEISRRLNLDPSNGDPS